MRAPVDLYRDGMAAKLLFTGGFNRVAQVIEADEMAKCARSQGVAPADIIVEREATNTPANVANALACIEASIGIDKVGSVLLVAIHFHMRRVKAIVAATFPARIRIGCASYPSAYYSSTAWRQSDRGRADVESETRKLQAYFHGHDGEQLRR